MKKGVLSLLLFLMAITSSLRAQVVDRFFADVPQSVLPLLDSTAKLDLIDLYNEHLHAKAENVMGGQSEIVRKTDNYLKLKLTVASTWQMKVLHHEQDTVIVCVHSVCADDVFSRITVYGTDWAVKPLELPHPVPQDFYVADKATTSVKSQMMQAHLPELPMEIEWNDSLNVLSYRLSTQSLSEELKKCAATCLRRLDYRWEKGGFVSAALRKETE